MHSKVILLWADSLSVWTGSWVCSICVCSVCC